MNNRWTSLMASFAILLFAGAADGLMDLLGPAGFLLAGAAVMGTTWVMAEVKLDGQR